MTRHILRWTALAAVLATAACSGTPAPAPVVRVDRGIVATSVSASGTLVSITEQNLGFAEGGELAEVLVEVGDRVAPGQVLARLDNRALEQALEQSQAQLDQARAALDKIENGNQVEGAAASLEQSQEIVAATEDQVAATDASNDSAIERAKTQLDFDRSTLADAEETLAEDEESCDSEPTVTSTSSTTTGGSSSTTPTQDSAAGSATTPVPTAAAESTAAESTPNPACDRVASGETAVRQAEGTVIASETALETAEQRETVDAASGRLSIENARANVVSAQNQLDLARTDRPADTASQAATVRDAQAAVALARGSLDDTALRAPVAGVVSAINGAVGEFVGPASGTTALAPGSSARLPALADAAGTGTGATTTSGAFLVLNGVDSFQLVVPFEESDAARVQPGQVVDVTVDALPGLTRPATVLATSPTGDDASGIVSYYSTIVLNESDPQLRDGQTAEASVRVQDVDNVLRVPSSVVRTENGGSVVDIPAAEGGDPVVTPFQPGTVGDEYTEVRAGLRDGQEILLPQGQVSSVQGGPPQN